MLFVFYSCYDEYKWYMIIEEYEVKHIAFRRPLLCYSQKLAESQLTQNKKVTSPSQILTKNT